MITDIDDILEKGVRWTLFLWLIPYMIWYFGRVLFDAAWTWVTEPEPEDEFLV